MIVVLVAGLYAAVSGGAIGEALRLQAERSISPLVGHDVEVSFGGTGLTLAGGTLVSLRIDDARISDALSGRPMVEAGSAVFGVRLLPLLAGNLRLGTARLSDARIDLSRQGTDGGPGWAAIMDDRGLVDADRLGSELFRIVHKALDALEDGATDRIELASVELTLGDGGHANPVAIERARLERVTRQGAALHATLNVDGRPLTLAWTASRPQRGAPVDNLEASLHLSSGERSGNSPLNRHVGEARIELAGRESAAGFERLSLRAELGDFIFNPGHETEALFDVRLAAFTEPGLDKLEISELSIMQSRSLWRFHGAVGAIPDGSAADAYRYELISDGSLVSPEGSLEPPIDVLARIAGTISPGGRRVEVDDITVRTAGGEVNGRASVTLDPGLTPGLDLEITVADFAMGDAKQLWPWFAAPGARNWVHDNVFGGRVVEGRVDLSVAPGRLGDGNPLRPGEVSGEFHVKRVRFDVAGRIPAVREGVGNVVFNGSVVDVSLDSGTVFLPSGRTVAANNGTFRIDAAGDRRLIGELDIDVAGRAAAIVELAGYDPISVDRYLDLAAEDFSGDVSGKIIADIPLRAGVDRDSLDWIVMLDYSDLSLARPFNGHEISGATGSILVEPQRVVIDAEARLDGIPARVNLVEPLGGEEAGKRQDIVLEVGDDTRDRLMPGLATILAGRASVEMHRGDGADRRIGVDLANSTVSIPWAGWSKGPGIPARANFTMETSDSRTILEDFAFGGETFAVNGRVTIDAGQLANARFGTVRLNRGDEFSVAIDRSGHGYRIEVTGQSLDARSLIKHLTTETNAAGQSVEGMPITLDLRVARVHGFHGEFLDNVVLEYRGTGSNIDTLRISATTAVGHPVQFRHDTVDGARNVAMQSTDAGAILRFLDIYERIEQGSIQLALSGAVGAPLAGHVDARDFWIVNEPRLGSIVSTTPEGGDRSLNQAVRRQIDVSRQHFDRGFAEIGKGPGYLWVEHGLLRGQDIGTTFRGMLYDGNGEMDVSGTFMPAYGLNRIFGEIPLLGQILGNGRDGGLIGITYRLSGKAGEPQLQINPLSAVAPGIFRSVFEFR